MTQSNEIPDILYVSTNPSLAIDDRFQDTYMASSEALSGDVKCIRLGAPTEFIDPKVQPIPVGLAGCRPLWCKYQLSWLARKTENIELRVEQLSVSQARDLKPIARKHPLYYSTGMTMNCELIGYVILPPV